MTTHDLLSALGGGALIGLAAGLLLIAIGRVAGVSGILNGAIEETGQDRAWRWLFLGGLVLGALGYAQIRPDDFELRTDLSWTIIAAGGLLVGAGTRLGSGCTSGHGVCGAARLSVRSIIATAVFMGTGIASTFVVRHLLGIAT